MTVRVSRVLEFDAEPEQVWAFIADPEKRADAISVVERYETEGDSFIWRVSLPIPFLNSTISVRTRDVERDPPRHVKFVGRSRAFHVTGEHTIEATDDGCRLTNEFVVDGRLPGVEGFFERNFEGELDNLERALREELSGAE